MTDTRLERNRRITESGCWEWTASVTRAGYGRISWNGKVRRVHRVMASIAYGIGLDGNDRVCHRCDNPPCFNPDHLFVGTQSDNVADMVAKGRNYPGPQPHPFCKKGHPLEGNNIKRTSNGRRRCRECARLALRTYYRNRKARTVAALNLDTIGDTP